MSNWHKMHEKLSKLTDFRHKTTKSPVGFLEIFCEITYFFLQTN